MNEITKKFGEWLGEFLNEAKVRKELEYVTEIVERIKQHFHLLYEKLLEVFEKLDDRDCEMVMWFFVMMDKIVERIGD